MGGRQVGSVRMRSSGAFWRSSVHTTGVRGVGVLENFEQRVISHIHSMALPAAVVALGFAVLARLLRAVSDGGAVAGAGIAFLWMTAVGLRGIAPLLTVFLLTLLATRWRGERKRNIGVAERGRGRVASQVFANLGASGLCAAVAIVFPQRSWMLLIGAMAALAEAAADTVSSEVGQALARQPRMILGLAPAPTGTNGAITIEGTLAGGIAASVVTWTGTLLGVVPWAAASVITVAGICGMLLDSVLGATLENRGKLGNDSVNFISTVFAADLALIVVLVMRG
jgi:uncharacterized protein (TIGR00297 family)